MLPLLGVSLVLGLAAGFITGGRPAGIRHVRIRWLPLLYAALVAGLFPLIVDTPRGLRTTLLIGSMLAVLGVLAVSITSAAGAVRAGLGVIALGWALNFAAIAPNDGMPLSLWAAGNAGLARDEITAGTGGFFKSVIAREDTVLRPLGDVIPVSPLEIVVSIGDLLLMAGVAIVVAGGMRSGAASAPDHRA